MHCSQFLSNSLHCYTLHTIKIQMDDFASPNITSAYDVPPAKNNFISPGKRPMSSMSTTVVTDQQGRVVAVAGASGGTKIITAVAQVWQ